MGKRLKGCLMGCGLVVLILALGVVGLVMWYQYSSPVLEAGREFNNYVNQYHGEPVNTRAELEERLNILNDHYDSPTFDKMRGGERTDVRLSDIEKLFGAADITYTDEPLDSIRVVHQYHVEDLTLNIHEGYGQISEFITEEYSGTLYDQEALDQLFLQAVHQYDILYERSLDNGRQMIPIEDGPAQFVDSEPTRSIYHNTWNRDSTYTYYYDDGLAEFSPEEYLAFTYEDTINGEMHITSFERRYRDGFEFDESDAIYEEKLDKAYELREYLEVEDNPDLEEEPEQVTIPLGELVEEFGDYAVIWHGPHNNELRFLWYLPDGDNFRAIDARGEANASMSDLFEVEIGRLGIRLASDTPFETEDFIGSR